MLIPENLQTFSNPTLILIANFGKAAIYKAHDMEISELTSIAASEPAHTDPESSVAVGAGRHAQTDSGIDEGEDRKQYTKQVVQKLSELISENSIQELQLIAPAELLRRVQEELLNQQKELISKTLDKDLVKETLMEALERLHEIPKALS